MVRSMRPGSKALYRVFLTAHHAAWTLVMALGSCASIAAGPEAKWPCLVAYARDSQIADPTGKILTGSRRPDEQRIRLGNCVGVRVIKGTAVVVVQNSTRFERIVLKEGATFSAAQLPPARDPSSPWGLGDLLDLTTEFRSDQSVTAGTRGTDDPMGAFFQDALNGHIVFFPEDGPIRIPVSERTGSTVAGITLSGTSSVRLEGQTIVIDSSALKPGGFYGWTVRVDRNGGVVEYQGEFSSADRDEIAALRAARVGATDSTNDASERLLATAGFYLARGLRANATITMAQWSALAQLPAAAGKGRETR